MKVALTCIARDEDNYIEEWINYNLKLGFDDIFIYQHNWHCNIDRYNVHKINWGESNIQNTPGTSIQVGAYNDFIQNNHKNYDWVAFFDVDEFLVLKKHNNVKDFILEYEGVDAIGINWIFFGSNNLSFDGDYSVLKRFTKRSKFASSTVKCIVKADKNINYMVHNPVNRMTTDTHYNKFWGVTNDAKKIDIAQLNHYYSKTWDEWKKKQARNTSIDTAFKGITPNEEYNDTYFHTNDKNEIEDTLALDFYFDKIEKHKKSDMVSKYRRLKGGDIPLIKNPNINNQQTNQKKQEKLFNHFYQYVDGWFNYEELYSDMVNRFGNDSKFVEVGVWKGKSAAYMAVEIINSGKKIHFDCVDNWEYVDGLQYDIDKSLFGDNLYQEFLSNINPVIHVINPIKSISWEAAKLYDDESIDFVFIDAAHDYESVKKDVTSWLPKVKKQGIIAGHDYITHIGVKNAVDEIIPAKARGWCWVYEKS